MEYCSGKVEIRDSRFGKGLFAAADLPAGMLLCSIRGRLMNFRQTLELQERESHAVQVGPDTYYLCKPPFLYSNHSCVPNCGVNAELQFVTIRDIKKDEELLWDYSTSMLERHWTMACQCGEASCRKLVTDFDVLPSELQAFYLQQQIVLPFIVTYLERRLGRTG